MYKEPMSEFDARQQALAALAEKIQCLSRWPYTSNPVNADRLKQATRARDYYWSLNQQDNVKRAQ